MSCTKKSAILGGLANFTVLKNKWYNIIPNSKMIVDGVTTEWRNKVKWNSAQIYTAHDEFERPITLRVSDQPFWFIYSGIWTNTGHAWIG